MAPPIQKQNETPKSSDAVSAELEQLRKENERLKLERAQMEAAMSAAAKVAAEQKGTAPASAELPEKYRGVKQYRVGAAGAYREGRHYTEGEIITLVDAVPSRTWTPYEKKAAPAAVEAPPADTARDADAAI